MPAFNWEQIGDIAEGRENLGETMPVAVYRLLLFTVTETMTEMFGRERADEVLRDAGFKAGQAFADKVLQGITDFNEFVAKLKDELKNLKIGVMRIEKADLANLDLTLTVSEDLDCSGLPISGDAVCVYDEGFIAGILEYHTGKKFDVREIDCWATGDRTCRFTAKGRVE